MGTYKIFVWITHSGANVLNYTDGYLICYSNYFGISFYGMKKKELISNGYEGKFSLLVWKQKAQQRTYLEVKWQFHKKFD